jgi:hypothetical protein
VSEGIEDFYVHTVTVKEKTGTGANGDVYTAAQAVTGYLDGTAKLVRAADGEQALAQSQFYCSVADGAKFSLDSVVTQPDGHTGQVIMINTLDVGGLLDGVEHTVVYLA